MMSDSEEESDGADEEEKEDAAAREEDSPPPPQVRTKKQRLPVSRVLVKIVIFWVGKRSRS